MVNKLGEIAIKVASFEALTGEAPSVAIVTEKFYRQLIKQIHLSDPFISNLITEVPVIGARISNINIRILRDNDIIVR